MKPIVKLIRFDHCVLFVLMVSLLAIVGRDKGGSAQAQQATGTSLSPSSQQAIGLTEGGTAFIRIKEYVANGTQG